MFIECFANDDWWGMVIQMSLFVGGTV
jgi:hypothetical protein